MLPVGREINIQTKKLVCRVCAWEGRGAELSSGLIRISHTDIYLYAYRCPECGSFDVASKGKLLAFRSRVTLSAPGARNEAETMKPHSIESRRRN
jgi:hypothetical protein